MNQGIKTINIIFDDNESIIVDESLFSHFYISNIDDDANEIPYEKLFDTNILYANFLSLKINYKINEYYNQNIIKKIQDKKNIAKIILSTENNKEVLFQIASDIDPFKKNSTNSYDQSFIEEKDLCLLITPYKIKFKNHLFT